MLVMQLKVGDTFKIGDNVEACIVQIRGSQVRIAIKAPRDVKILRGELVLRIVEKLEDPEPI